MAGLSTRLRRPCRYACAVLQPVSIITTPALLLRQKLRADEWGKAYVSGGDRMHIQSRLENVSTAERCRTQQATAALEQLQSCGSAGPASVLLLLVGSVLSSYFHILALQSLCPWLVVSPFDSPALQSMCLNDSERSMF